MKADKMTMATSIELRVPFLDYRLVEWLASRPARSKVGRDSSGRLVSKSLLRRFCRGRIPDEVITRPKEGFPNPLREWIAADFGAEAGATLLAPSSWTSAHFDRSVLKRLVNERGRSPTAGDRVWVLYLLELWAQRWL
jgi:asparagine synthase (glutamine-hydrolysing)